MAIKSSQEKINTKVSFKPQAVTKRLISVLPDRAKDIITKRYGLGNSASKMTLEAIGGKYGITRERVRQIENYALSSIRKSPDYEKESKVFDEIESLLYGLGGIVAEEEFLSGAFSDAKTQNHVHFLLVLGSSFIREKEDAEFLHRWFVDRTQADKVKGALRKLYEKLSNEELIPEEDIIDSFLDELSDVSDEHRSREVVRRWLSLSKKIGGNPLGEWGRSHSSNVNPKGVRDYAYLVIRQHGSPMHFTEVAKNISQQFNKRAHTATTHNELIKDDRFVLVGRGLYALTEWGYMEGVVKDVIKSILEKGGPLTRDEIIDRVLKERYVKGNTVLVNLQDNATFKKTSDGKYYLS
jgi:hypothetical protein